MRKVLRRARREKNVSFDEGGKRSFIALKLTLVKRRGLQKGISGEISVLEEDAKCTPAATRDMTYLSLSRRQGIPPKLLSPPWKMHPLPRRFSGGRR